MMMKDLDRAATLVSQERYYSCADTSSKSEEEKRYIRFDDLATTSKLFEIIVPAAWGTFGVLATTVQQLVGNRIVVIPCGRSTVDSSDFHSIRLKILSATSISKIVMLCETYHAARKQEDRSQTIKSGHDEFWNGE
jgi:hypothetical protein